MKLIPEKSGLPSAEPDMKFDVRVIQENVGHRLHFRGSAHQETNDGFEFLVATNHSRFSSEGDWFRPCPGQRHGVDRDGTLPDLVDAYEECLQAYPPAPSTSLSRRAA